MERKLYATSSCPSCGSQELLRLSMTVAGSPVVFAACNTCEWRAWEREGENLPLTSLLGLISTR